MKPKRSVIVSGIVAALLAALLLRLPTAAQPRPTVTIRLSWKIKGEFAPLFVAVEKGFYASRGVNVRVLEGTGAGPTLVALANGNDEFAYVAAFEAAQGVGRDLPIVMVANYIRKDPSVLASFAPLQRPKDLEGKSIATAPADRLPRLWPVFARAHGIDASTVNIVTLDPGVGVAQFLQGRLDVLSAFYTNEIPVVEARAGRRLNVLWMADYGFNFLGHGLVTSVKFAQEHPAVVKAVIAGTREGFAYGLRHPVEAGDILMRLFPDALERGIVAVQIANTFALVQTKAVQGRPIGWNPPEEWQRTLDLMIRHGFLPKARPLRDYFTNQFIDE